MKPDPDLLGRYLRQFLGEYLPRQRNASPRTILAYRDALKFLLQFSAGAKQCSVAELAFSDLDRTRVLAFLEDIEKRRGNTVSTRNHRLAAVRAFFRFVSTNSPEAVGQCAQILGIPMKRTETRAVDYLTLEETKAIIATITPTTAQGSRDDALLRFMHNTGGRVQEVVDVRAKDLHLGTPAHVLLHGKGRKERLCPLWPETTAALKRLLEQHGVEHASAAPVFTNRHGKPLTRFGVRYILAKYVRAASTKEPTLARKHVHPHVVRHATAMHLLQSGVDLNSIRCWLGHASVVTTNRYIEADLEMKRRALERITPPKQTASPNAIEEAALLTWLEGL